MAATERSQCRGRTDTLTPRRQERQRVTGRILQISVMRRGCIRHEEDAGLLVSGLVQTTENDHDHAGDGRCMVSEQQAMYIYLLLDLCINVRRPEMRISLYIFVI